MSTEPQNKQRTINRDRLITAFRDGVLASLDESAKEAFKPFSTGVLDAGASDSDLPALFRVLDAHAVTLAERFGFIVNDLDEYNEDAKPEDFKALQRVNVHPSAWVESDRVGVVSTTTSKGVWVRLERSGQLKRFHPSLLCVSSVQVDSPALIGQA